MSLHNIQRLNNSLDPLVVNSLLVNSATAKAQTMLESDCWAHFCPNGKSPWDFFEDAGYVYVFAGENLAEGFSDNEAVMTAWMNSTTHRENVLKKEFKEVGIGIATGDFQGNPNNTIIVVHFGNRLDSFTNLPSSTAENTDIIKNDTDAPEPPVVTSPPDEDITNNNLFEIKGTSEEGTAVDVFDDEILKGSVGTEGGIFAYRPAKNDAYIDGEHTLTAYAFDPAGNRSQSSEVVNVTVDTIPPTVRSDLLEVIGSEFATGLKLRIPVEDDTFSVFLVGTDSKINLTNLPSSKIWEANITKEDFIIPATFQIIALDKAGNETVLEINSATILGEIINVEEQITQSATPVGVLNQILARELPSLRSTMSFAFLLFFGALFLIDALVLANTQVVKAPRSKSHLHLASFLIFIFAILIGGIGGGILEGTNI